MPIIILAAIIIIAFIITKKQIKNNIHYAKDKNTYIKPYEAKNILTNHEVYFYRILYSKIKDYNLIICPKVRLEDFISVTDQNNKLKYRGYIRSRHVDFLICDKELNIKFAIELDDKSHQTDYAKKIDRFKNDLFKMINIPLYRINKEFGSYEEQINNIIKNKEAN